MTQIIDLKFFYVIIIKRSLTIQAGAKLKKYGELFLYFRNPLRLSSYKGDKKCLKTSVRAAKR